MAKEIEDFRNKFKFGIHKLFDVDPPIAEKAAKYRDFYRSKPVKNAVSGQEFTNLATPDAIHLATAVIYECQEFWTFDGLNPSADKHQTIKPLWLNNKVGEDKIIIAAPVLNQGVLFPN
jgi:hypothetical protein